MNYKDFLKEANNLLVGYYNIINTIEDNNQYIAVWQIAELYGRIQAYLDLEEIKNDEQTKADIKERDVNE